MRQKCASSYPLLNSLECPLSAISGHSLTKENPAQWRGLLKRANYASGHTKERPIPRIRKSHFHEWLAISFPILQSASKHKNFQLHDFPATFAGQINSLRGTSSDPQ